MACARGAKDGAMDLGNSRLRNGGDLQGPEDEASRSILVSHIPEGVNRDKLEIHFMRASNGGADIESVTMVTDTEAKITYLDGTAVERVLERPHVLNGVEVKVQKWTPPEDNTKKVKQAIRSILVSNIPKGVNRDKLEIHFMKSSNGGGEIESITMVTDAVAVITYQDSAAVKTVLEKQHVLSGKQLTVEEEADPEVFDEVHATVDPKVAHLIPQDLIDKVKKETGIKWEKDVVKGTYKQVADAQQLLQQYLEQHCKQMLESTNDSTTTTHKESKTANDKEQTPNDHPKGTKAVERNFKITGLDDESPAYADMDPQSTSMKPPDEAEVHLNPNTVKGRADYKEGTERDGEMSPGPTASNWDASGSLESDHKVKEEDNKGSSSQDGNIEEGHTEHDEATGREEDGQHPQQTGEQVEDAAKSSSSSDGQQMSTLAPSTLNVEGSSRGSAGKDEDMEATTAAEEPEEMDTGESPNSVHANSPIGPLSDDDESMPSDDDEPQTPTSSSSSLPEKPRKDAPASPPNDVANNDVRREKDERHSQEGQQVEDANKGSLVSFHNAEASSTSNNEKDKRLQMASGTLNGEGSPRGSDNLEASTAAEMDNRNTMETEYAPDSVHGDTPPQPLSENAEPMLSDNDGPQSSTSINTSPPDISDGDGSSRENAKRDVATTAAEKVDTKVAPNSDNDEQLSSGNNDPQTQSSKNSRLPKEPRKDVPSNTPTDVANIDDQVPGDQTITRGIQAKSVDPVKEDENDSRPTHNDASPDDPTTTNTGSQRHELPSKNDAEARQSQGSKKQRNKAFYKENLGKNFMQVYHLSSGATGATDNLPTGKEHKAGSASSTGSGQEDSSPFEVFVDPDILTYIRHKYHAEISDIGKRYKSVFHTSTDNTQACFSRASPSVGKDPEPEKAIDEFITLYQQVFSRMKCENFDVAQYKFAPTYLLNGVRSIRGSHNEVLTNVNEDNTTVTFMGEPEKIREARTAFCGLMGISISRNPRRRGNRPTTSTESAGGSTDAPKGAKGGQNSPEPVLLYTHTFEQGVEVKVAHGNITTLNVDAIVNAADGQLKHGGGVAKAIVEAGGYIIQKESTEKMKTRGFLKPSETEITGAGSLPCKNIIHAHGPKWQGANQATWCTEMLTRTCINILHAAEGLKAESVAIPAISSGKYAMPKEDCAQALLSGVLQYLSTKRAPSCSLRKIWFIDMTEDTIQVIAEVFATEISLFLQSPSGYGKAKSKPTVKQSQEASQPQVSIPSHPKTYASVAANGGSKAKLSPATGHSYRNDSSQVAAALGRGHGFAQHVIQDRSSLQGKGGATGGGNNGTTTGMAIRDKTSGQPNTEKDKNDEECPICLTVPTKPTSLPCKNQGCKAVFCKKCLDKAMDTKSCCPVCSAVVGKLMGNQPEGSMTVTYNRKMKLEGYKQTGAIIIEYVFTGGIQGLEHPNPGKPYTGTTRKAYLPYNHDGTKVLGLLEKAFAQKLTFTIGTSSTTGRSDTVIWNDIHHKTSTYGGASMHGYPDPGYLKRVTEELAAKGIK
ncbi:PREDICTED: uncharacterized protein LOC109477530 isoform X2 [Branchiostoma belcheri]|uniref:RING-type E3 ubiquitin transferase n=1 Tax=Branchiostoma belcheri TaxID=7741 RepID=A0A6P4ZXQ4_BRABE|nr:PREDICTED: uncharacterized protein LOC109477530 isoform X2 [Branchiostoma belcheri]